MSFARYSKYQPSGIEWFGDVPASWTATKLGKLLTSPACYGVLVPDFEPGGIPMLRITDLESRPVLRTSLTTISAALSAQFARTVVAEGDLVISVVGTIGKTLRIDSSLAGVNLSRAVARLQIDSAVDGGFLCWLLQSNEFARYVDTICTGTAQRVLNIADLISFRFLLPTLREQSSIDKFLDRETAKIDALIVEQERLIELLKEKRQAVIFYAVTKGLNPDAQIKSAGAGWIGGIPAKWTMKRLKHISPSLTVGIVVNPTNYVSDDGLPFLYGADIREGVIDYENARRISAVASAANRKTRLQAGDLLTVRVGAPGVTAVVPPECEGGNCASVMLIRRGSFDSRWLCYAMNARIVRHQVQVVQYGAAQEQFNISHAVNFWVPVPPEDEQTSIADYLDRETKRIDDLVESAYACVTLYRDRRSALISAAVTGQIDVRGLAEQKAA